jgi:hypothetical protein
MVINYYPLRWPGARRAFLAASSAAVTLEAQWERSRPWLRADGWSGYRWLEYRWLEYRWLEFGGRLSRDQTS